MPNPRLTILFKKQLQQNTSPEEEEELREMMADPANEVQLNELLNESWDLFEPGENKLAPGEKKAILSNIFNDVRQLPVSRRSVLRSGWLRSAAAIVVIAAAATFYFMMPGTSKQRASTHKENQVVTQPHSKTTLQLADGTQVWLHSNSKLVYDNETFGKKNRKVTLIGEAYFDVVKNAAIPFIIHTGQVNITVKGTAFNVKAYPKDKTVETTLVRGLIEITTVQDPDRKILLKPNEKIIIPISTDSSLSTSQITTPSPYSITRLKPTVEAPAEIAWIQTQLVFDNETFGNLAPKMASWYNIGIEFMSEEIKQKRFSGTIETETLRQILEAMKLSSPFDYRISNNVLYIDSK